MKFSFAYDKSGTIEVIPLYEDIQPVKEIAEIAHRSGSLFMTDASQAVGKVPIDEVADGIDLLALSGHKIYGPKGVGHYMFAVKIQGSRLQRKWTGAATNVGCVPEC